MLPSPYGDCRNAENYTYMRCMGQCQGHFTQSTCGCRPAELDGRPIHLQKQIIWIVSIAYFVCIWAVPSIWHENLAKVISFSTCEESLNNKSAYVCYFSFQCLEKVVLVSSHNSKRSHNMYSPYYARGLSMHVHVHLLAFPLTVVVVGPIFV